MGSSSEGPLGHETFEHWQARQAELKTICQKCGQRVRVEDLCLQSYGFLGLKMRLTCPACYGVSAKGGGDGHAG